MATTFHSLAYDTFDARAAATFWGAVLHLHVAPGASADSAELLDVTSADASKVLAYAAPLIVVAGLFQLVDGLQSIASGLLRGLKDARVPMILALVAYWPIGFFLAWLLAFPLGFGGIGIWFGFLLGLASAAAMLCARFYILVRSEIAAA